MNVTKFFSLVLTLIVIHAKNPGDDVEGQTYNISRKVDISTAINHEKTRQWVIRVFDADPINIICGKGNVGFASFQIRCNPYTQKVTEIIIVSIIFFAQHSVFV